jgi:FkbM family methyltransferase
MLAGLKRGISAAVRRALAARNRAVVPADLPWVDGDFVHRVIRQRGVGELFDIGANEGQFALRLRQSGYAGRLISFEPQPGPYAALCKLAASDASWECVNLGLGEAPAKLEMHVSGWSVSSSLLPIGRRHVELMPATAEVGTVSVDVVRLDDWVAGRGGLGSGPLFLKIDVQGYEGPVLRGGETTIASADGALVELNFADLFEGQTKYFEVMRHLEQAGLRFCGLFEVNLDPQTRAALWADGLFLRG